MADKKKTGTKSETKSDKSADTKSADTKSDGGTGADAKSKGYSRGENQKPVTEDYRSNWDQIFGKKKRSAGK